MPTWRTLMVGGAVLLAGFGVMNAFWKFGDWPADLRGLWDYRSATIGDGLLLPVSAAILTGAAMRLPQAPGDRHAALVTGGLAAIVGIASQWSWLRDPAPELNWTLPEPHTFNAAGWYHAAFLVAASAYLAGAGMMVLWRARALRRAKGADAARRYLEHPWAALLLACLLGFVALLVLDSAGIVSTAATQATLVLVLLGAAASLALIRWSFGPITAPGFRNLVTALLFAIALGGLTRDWPASPDVSAIDVVVAGMLLLAIGTQLIAWESPIWQLETVTCAMWLLVGFGTLGHFAIDRWADVWLVLVPLTVMLVPIGLIMLVFAEPDEKVADGRILFFALPVPLLVTLVADVLAHHRGLPVSSQIVDYAFTVLVIYWLVWLGGQRYRLLPITEVREEPGLKLELSMVATWTALTGIFGGTLAGFVYSIEVAEPGLGWDSPQRIVSPYPAAVLAIAAVACAIGAAAWRISRPETSDSKIWLGPAMSIRLPTLRLSNRAWAGAMLAAIIWLAMPLICFIVERESLETVIPIAPGAIGWVALVVAVVLSIWLAGISYLSLKGNVDEIEFFRLGGRERLLQWVTAAAVGGSTFWLLAAGIWHDQGLVRLIDIMLLSAIVILANTALPATVAGTFARATPDTGATPRYVSLHHPATNVGHDHLLHGYMLLLGIGVIFLAYRLSQTQIGGWAAAALAVLPLALTYLEQTLVTEKNYAQHIRAERKRGAESESLKARLEDPSKQPGLNALRCDLIARRARLVHRFVMYVNPLLFVLSLVGSLFGALKRWVVGDGPILPDAADAGPATEHPVYVTIVEARGSVQLPHGIMRILDVEPGDIVSFTPNGAGDVLVDTIDYRTAYRVFGEESAARRRQARWVPREETVTD